MEDNRSPFKTLNSERSSFGEPSFPLFDLDLLRLLFIAYITNFTD